MFLGWEGSNSNIAWYTKAGDLQNSQTLASFFPAVNQLPPPIPPSILYDPKVVFDQYNNRFVVVAQTLAGDGDANPANDESRILLAVSNTADPNAGWNFGFIDSEVNVGGVNSWADYPGFAVGQDAVYVTSNMFSFNDRQFQDSRLWIIPKAGFYGGGALTSNIFDPSGVPSQLFTLQPAHTFGTLPGTTGTFLVSAIQIDADIEGVAVIRVDNPLGAPTFTNTSLNVGDISNRANPDAPQSGGAQGINTSNNRLYNAVWRNNQLYTVNTVNPPRGIDAGQATAHYYRIDTTNLAALTIADQADIGGEDIAAGAHTFYPAVAVDNAGNVGVGFSASSPTTFAGAYYTGRLAGDAAFQPTGTLRTGLASYVANDPFGRNRWGDYSGILLDPSDGSTFWLFNEYARGTPNQWGTAFGNFSLTATSGTLQFSAPVFSVNENGIPVVAVTVTRTGGSTGVVGATVSFTGGTATGGAPALVTPEDYDNTPILVSFGNGVTAPQTVTVPILDDTVVEQPDETVNLSLGTPTGGATIGAQSTAVLTIIDNDTSIQFGNAAFNVAEGSGGGFVNSNVVTVTRTGITTGSQSAQVGVNTTTPGTALGGNAAVSPTDYNNAGFPFTLNFAPGETTKTVSIPIFADTVVEGNETLGLQVVPQVEPALACKILRF